METVELMTHLRMPELGEFQQYLRAVPTYSILGIGTIAALTMYWYTSKPKAQIPPCDLSMQSIEVDKFEHTRKSVLLKEGQDLMTVYYQEVQTLYDVLKRGLIVSGNGPCVGCRKPNQPFQWISYREVSERAECIGSGFIRRGYKGGNSEYIGIYAQNRPEWVIVEQACYAFSMVVVPLYDTLGIEAISFIINKADMEVVVCDTAGRARMLLNGVETGITAELKTIVVMESFGEDLVHRGIRHEVEVVSLAEIEKSGKEKRHKTSPAEPKDLAVICFTSGTTGKPKGAMLTHKNIVANFSAFVKVTEGQWTASPSDIHISFLPLAHMFERLVQTVVLCHGGRIGFFQGDIRLLMDDIKLLKPTIFPIVPRLANRLYDKIHSQAKGFFKRKILQFASWRKIAELQKGIMRRDSIWDFLVFRKIQDSLGGQVKLMVIGAAPVSDTVLDFVRAAMGCQFYEGFGQTECTAGCSMTIPGDWSAGHVGAPMPCNLVKLVDVHEMNYFSANGEGEVCVKGPNVFTGYLKDPEKTGEVLDESRWLYTGDIGKWLPNGTLKIIDRKKHIFKLAQGEYIAPEKIENIYVRCELIAQVFVHGDGLQAFLVGIVVPDPEVLPEWASKRNLKGSYEELCKSKALKDAILANMLKVGKEAGLKTFEQVKDIHLYPEMLTVQNGLLTPTFKTKRLEMRKFFHKQIAELYAENAV
ncbi:long-chain-fatty-acid--CoA ligase 1 isoform X2 [Amblyraja radiata]|uniref:long-chain-fatty-acid--CoA ligase 1 isoform X2 n=1 Tax=Amblyraja radiata TaxID=386614 RepID=UPI0014035380|nr:long-chain-fatty-acid--CoA ligase 1 isoform X2 [Amblyraja radiata]